MSTSGGVLSMNAGSYIHKTGAANLADVDLSGMTIEFKARCTEGADNDDWAFDFSVLDDSMDRQFLFYVATNGEWRFGVGQEYGGSPATSMGNSSSGYIDNPDDWHVYRITSDGATDPELKLYIDGLLMATVTLDQSDSTSNDIIILRAFSDLDVEYIGYATEVSAPIAANATTNGQIDDIAVSNTKITDETLTALTTTRADAVISGSGRNGLSIVNPVIGPNISSLASVTSVTGGTGYIESYHEFYIPFDGITRVYISYIMSVSLTSDLANDDDIVFTMVANDQTGNTSITYENDRVGDSFIIQMDVSSGDATGSVGKVSGTHMYNLKPGLQKLSVQLFATGGVSGSLPTAGNQATIWTDNAKA
jgi:hypothetical protein